MVPWIHSRLFCIPVYIFLFIVKARELTDAQIDVVSMRLAESAKASWELGTRAQTILERNATSYSVFSTQRLPPPSSPDGVTQSALQPFYDIADDIVSSLSESKNNTSPQPLVPGDGSAADPASIGICILITNWTRTAIAGGSRGLDYAGAAKSQIDYLFTVPRTSDGAISHRVSQLQLWSDFVYMVPPFLAYYGVMTWNRTMLLEAYNQIKLYRRYLRDPGQGMWRHVLLGESWTDPGFWSTGNGWAAAGTLRVYATIRNSEYAPSLEYQLRELSSWVQEIHEGMYRHLDDTSLFANYADRPANSQGNFYDAASTALLASTVYRASQLLGQHEYLAYAEKSRKALLATNSTSGSQRASLVPYTHFTTDGILVPVVDPYSMGVQATTVSPEGQAFVVQMHQAWKDWKDWKVSRTRKSGEESSRAYVGFLGSKVSILVIFIVWGFV